MESLLAATTGVASILMRANELGKIHPNYFADCILVDGDPLEDITILQDHSKLNLILINGRIHKASQKDFMTSSQRTSRLALSRSSAPALNGFSETSQKIANYVVFVDSTGHDRVGHLDLQTSLITPLSMPSGAPLRNLYQVIELAQSPVVGGSPIALGSTTLLPPISGRDIIAVGKNYVDHAKEFHASGYDSSDKVAQPTHPVIFTKRSSSIIAHGVDISLDPDFTQSLDYEGEVGVIIGKSGRHIPEEDALSHVWGYTLINDVTAREVQRDHKQFYLGKSGDTYCPIGPIAVPATYLPSKIHIQTYVNGEKRQDATTDDLIFSVARLISTISLGATLQAGDVIATGTPAGVGFGQSPPTFLQVGDQVEVTATGLGTLRNRVVLRETNCTSSAQSKLVTTLTTFNTSRSPGGAGLTDIGTKKVNAIVSGQGQSSAVFVHGLGGSTNFYEPLLKSSHLEDKYKCIRYDLEGHGLSPTESTSIVSISSYVVDLAAVVEKFKQAGDPPLVLVAHSMGCLIALHFAAEHPSRVQKLVLLNPARYPVPLAAADAQSKRAAVVRAGGMRVVAETVATNGTSESTRTQTPTAYSAVVSTLISQDPEGYAKACTALGAASSLDINLSRLSMPILMVAGDEDKVSPVTACQSLCDRLSHCQFETVENVGHWSVYEDPIAVGSVVKKFLASESTTK